MTKQWDTYEATIKTLYAENTLSVVRQIMIDKYGFRASTRAYRGRLIRWGVRKYNCRKLSDRASSPASSANDGAFSSESDSASPVLASRSGGDHALPATDHDTTHHQLQADVGRRASDGGHLAMPGRINQQYGTMVGGNHQTQAYSTDDPYGNKTKAVLSPPQSSGVQYEWNATPSPLTSHNNNSTSNGVANFDNHAIANANVSADATMSPPYFTSYTQMAAPGSVSSASYAATIETSYNDVPDHSHGHSLRYYRTPSQQQGHDYDGAVG
ncbi:hypothetical protein F4821DRAFT_254767 [Hypoxylon rubiginosum]|uniref:Uncharacterized protein n=1 Tax=Hypoxylon rubiginosum TaxID=110542 RepID=A0ACC0DFV9_9PEZI|nr:hypothetical protein F4821DRAFT_254767 [Hypoxylon rubiginosum]